MLREQVIEALRGYSFRGKARLLNCIEPPRRKRTINLFGYQVDLDTTEFIQRYIYLGAYEMKDAARLRRHLRPGMVVIDAGANMGFYSLLAASVVGRNGKVFAIEPSPDAFSKLSKIVEGNLISQIKPSRVGFSDKEGEEDLYLPQPDCDNHTYTMVFCHSGHGPNISVPVTTLDKYMDEQNIDCADLLKVDVDGYETRLFAGASRALKGRRIKAILCEFSDFWLRYIGSSPHELHRMLTGYGFMDVDGVPVFEEGCLVNRFFVLK